jgi:hypothetical protein
MASYKCGMVCCEIPAAETRRRITSSILEARVIHRRVLDCGMVGGCMDVWLSLVVLWQKRLAEHKSEFVSYMHFANDKPVSFLLLQGHWLSVSQISITHAKAFAFAP